MKYDLHGLACVVTNKEGKILLLKRSPDKKNFPNKWFVVGAYPLAENDNFEEKAHIEMVDETGFDAKLIKKGTILKMESDGKITYVHTFLARRETTAVKLNKEHTEFKWVDISEIKDLDVVPGTYAMIDALIKDE